jgi:hypothetical protein
VDSVCQLLKKFFAKSRGQQGLSLYLPFLVESKYIRTKAILKYDGKFLEKISSDQKGGVGTPLANPRSSTTSIRGFNPATSHPVSQQDQLPTIFFVKLPDNDLSHVRHRPAISTDSRSCPIRCLLSPPSAHEVLAGDLWGQPALNLCPKSAEFQQLAEPPQVANVAAPDRSGKD